MYTAFAANPSISCALSVQFLADFPPVRHVTIHMCVKPLIVPSLQQVGQFMEDHILQTFDRVFRQLKVEPNSSAFCVAGSPPGLHIFDLPLIGMQPGDGLPLGQQPFDFGL